MVVWVRKQFKLDGDGSVVVVDLKLHLATRLLSFAHFVLQKLNLHFPAHRCLFRVEICQFFELGLLVFTVALLGAKLASYI